VRPEIRTLTVRRGDLDITVQLTWVAGLWMLDRAVDPCGIPKRLTPSETADVLKRAYAGEDETGR